jgi:hypothetical protein
MNTVLPMSNWRVSGMKIYANYSFSNENKITISKCLRPSRESIQPFENVENFFSFLWVKYMPFLIRIQSGSATVLAGSTDKFYAHFGQCSGSGCFWGLPGPDPQLFVRIRIWVQINSSSSKKIQKDLISTLL